MKNQEQEFIDEKKEFLKKQKFHASQEKVVSKEMSAAKQIKQFNLLKYLKDSCLFYRHNLRALKVELLSGITVAIMQIPESVTFSFVAGVDPIVGLYATFFMGLITGAIGGKAGMISGAAGALAVIAKDITDEDGALKDYSENDRFQHLMMTMVLCGIFQMLCAIFQLATLVKLIPYSAVVGFMNGLAIIIFKSQLDAFKECDGGKRDFGDCKANERDWIKIDEGKTWIVLFLVFLTMIVMIFYPRIPKIGKIIPSSLVAIILGTLFEHLINRPLIGEDVRTVGETTSIDGKLPTWSPPETPKDGYDWGVVINYSISLCFIGLFESVMTLQFLEELTKTLPSQFCANQECLAQGIGNLICGLFGAMGGDAMIGQSCINIKNNGARGRVSGMFAGIAIMVIILIAYKVIELIPIATLTGVLFMVVINTFNWNSLITIVKRKINIYDSIVIIIVTVFAVLTNLAYSVIMGIIFLSLAQLYQFSENMKVKIYYTKPNLGKKEQKQESMEKIQTLQDGNQLTEIKLNENENEQNKNKYVKPVKVYYISGYNYFPSLEKFTNSLNPEEDDDIVVIDFENCVLGDLTSVLLLSHLSQKYQKSGKDIYYANLREYTIQLIKDSYPKSKDIQIVPENLWNNYPMLYQLRHERQLLKQKNHSEKND